MTQEEFDFWQRAYLAVLPALCGKPDIWAMDNCAKDVADIALKSYRAAKATVVQTTYATGE
jgi:hypothetical protein